MERGSITSVIVAAFALIALCLLHFTGTATSSQPLTPDSFAGPLTGKPRPIEVDRNEPAGQGSLREVRCGLVAAGTRCWVAGR